MLCFGCSRLSVCIVDVKVIQMFEQFDLFDVVVALVKLAIGIAEYDDPNLVCCVSAHYHYKQISLFTDKNLKSVWCLCCRM